MRKILHVIFFNLLIAIVCLEALSFVLASFPWSVGRFYSAKSAFLRRAEVREVRYREFLNSVYDPVLGWTSPRSKTREIPDCRGNPVPHSYDQRGARNTPRLPAAREILAFGDSYTLGAEVKDEDAYPSQLSGILNRSVVNYGVGAYGPLQATLRFEKIAPAHPNAEIAILGIMSENPFRMLNSFRPIYQPDTGALFGFKPFMRDGGIQTNPNNRPLKDMADVLNLIEKAYDSDYYKLADAKFPFVFNLTKSLLSDSFYLRTILKMSISSIWELEAIQKNLKRVISMFIETAKTNNITPIILWIPQYQSHRHLLAQISMQFEQEFDGRATFVAVSNENYDWARYNVEKSGCHPSSYGYRIIAEHVAMAVENVTSYGAGRSAVNHLAGPLGR